MDEDLVRSRGAVEAKLKLGEVSCSEGKAEKDVTFGVFRGEVAWRSRAQL